MSNGTSAPYWSNVTNLTVEKASKDGDGNVITSTYVKKTDVASKGNSTTPVYFDSDGKAVALNYTIAKSVPSDAVFTDTVYTGINGISISGTSISNSGVRSVSTGGTNGTISVNTNGTLANVAVKGLGSSAYTNTDYFTHKLTFVDTGGLAAGNWYNGTQDQSISYNTIGAAPSVHTHSVSQITDIVTGSVHPANLLRFKVTLLFSKLVVINATAPQYTVTRQDWKSPSEIPEVEAVLEPSVFSTYPQYMIRPITSYGNQTQFNLPEQYRPPEAGVVGAAAVTFALDPDHPVVSSDSILIICSSGNVYVGVRPGGSTPNEQQDFMVYCSLSYIAHDPQ